MEDELFLHRGEGLRGISLFQLCLQLTPHPSWQVRMCQGCFHARKAANPRIVPVTPKAEKKGMSARGKRKKEAKVMMSVDQYLKRPPCCRLQSVH